MKRQGKSLSVPDFADRGQTQPRGPHPAPARKHSGRGCKPWPRRKPVGAAPSPRRGVFQRGIWKTLHRAEGGPPTVATALAPLVPRSETGQVGVRRGQDLAPRHRKMCSLFLSPRLRALGANPKPVIPAGMPESRPGPASTREHPLSASKHRRTDSGARNHAPDGGRRADTQFPRPARGWLALAPPNLSALSALSVGDG